MRTIFIQPTLGNSNFDTLKYLGCIKFSFERRNIKLVFDISIFLITFFFSLNFELPKVDFIVIFPIYLLTN